MADNPFTQVNVIAPALYEGTRTTSTRRTPVEKDAQRLMDVLNTRTFEPHTFAYLLTSYPIELQKPLFDLAMAILNAMAAKRVQGRCDNEELERCQAAEKVINIIMASMGGP